MSVCVVCGCGVCVVCVRALCTVCVCVRSFYERDRDLGRETGFLFRNNARSKHTIRACIGYIQSLVPATMYILCCVSPITTQH